MKTNKIYNGNCLEILPTFESKTCDVGFTSPPYNRIRNDKYKNYKDVEEDYLNLITRSTEELLRICRGDVIVNIQATKFNKVDVYKYIGKFAEKIKGIVIWEKFNPQPVSQNTRGGVLDYQCI